MSLLNYFRPKRKPAALSPKRLQIIVAHERKSAGPTWLPQLERDILDVIRKYVDIGQDSVSVQLEQKEDDLSVLELNVTLPE